MFGWILAALFNLIWCTKNWQACAVGVLAIQILAGAWVVLDLIWSTWQREVQILVRVSCWCYSGVWQVGASQLNRVPNLLCLNVLHQFIFSPTSSCTSLCMLHEALPCSPTSIFMRTPILSQHKETNKIRVRPNVIVANLSKKTLPRTKISTPLFQTKAKHSNQQG